MKMNTDEIKKSPGFTLVELISVMAILAVILMIAVPQMMGYIKSAHRASACAEAQITADAVQRFLDDEMEKSGGNLSGNRIAGLMDMNLDDSDGILKDYISKSQKDARIVKVNVDKDEGRLLGLIYETKYSSVTMTIDEEGNRKFKVTDKNNTFR